MAGYVLGLSDIECPPRCGTGTQLTVFTVTNGGDVPAVSAPDSIVVGSFQSPPNAPQKGTANTLDTLDGRLTHAVSGVDPTFGTTTLWAGHTVLGGAGSQINWYEVDPTGGAVVQSGAVQGGKDGALRLLRLPGLKLVQSLQVGGLFSAPAVSGNRLFVSTFEKTICFRLVGGRLQVVWQRAYRGTSPVVAGGLLYVYDPDSGLLRVLRPGTGAVVAQLQAGAGHWNSPIVADGMVALPEGDANAHEKSGVLNVWRLP